MEYSSRNTGFCGRWTACEHFCAHSTVPSVAAAFVCASAPPVFARNAFSSVQVDREAAAASALGMLRGVL